MFPITKSLPEGSVWWEFLTLINKPEEAKYKGNAFADLVDKRGSACPWLNTQSFSQQQLDRSYNDYGSDYNKL
jgi:hypothetical protein